MPDIMYFDNMTDDIPMNLRVKKYVPISNVAEILGLKRPTFYMLMDYYDEGRMDDIPDTVREFFDLIAGDPEPEDVKVFLRIKGSSDKSGDRKPLKIKDNRERDDKLLSVRREKQSLDKACASMEHEVNECKSALETTIIEHSKVMDLIDSNPKDNVAYVERARLLDEKIHALSEELNEKRIQLDRASAESAMMDYKLQVLLDMRNIKAERPSDSWTDDDGLITMCAGNNGRSMIVFRLLSDDSCEDFTVMLIMDTPDGEMTIGRYVPEKGKNFVLIDDVLPVLTLQYEVVCNHHGETIRSGRYPVLFK